MRKGGDAGERFWDNTGCSELGGRACTVSPGLEKGGIAHRLTFRFLALVLTGLHHLPLRPVLIHELQEKLKSKSCPNLLW